VFPNEKVGVFPCQRLGGMIKEKSRDRASFLTSDGGDRLTSPPGRLRRGKELLYQFNKILGWTQSWDIGLGKEKKISCLTGFQIADRPAHMRDVISTT